MKHIIITAFIFLSALAVSGKKTHRDCPKVYRSSKEVFDTSCDRCLKRIHENTFNNTIVAVNKSNAKVITPLDSIWGYRRKNDDPVRVVSKIGYQIIRNTPVYIYRQGEMKFRNYYFSTGPDGALYELSKKNLKQIFTNDSVYENIIANKNVKRFL
jgi:hypothetical protein